jgi:poly-beta-1,6-N-acetyl-D-glucosamine N-deacetylase
MKVLLFLFCLLAPIRIISATDYGTVFMYHRFNEPNHPSTNISEKVFRDHLVYLKENNFNVLPISRLIDFFKDTSPLPEKSVFITVDDGYKSFYNIALPMLLEFEFPFSIFISTDYVSENPNSNFMSWDMLREIKEYGGSIYNHVSDHSNLNNFSEEEIILKIKKASHEMKKNLGLDPLIFSYPYGTSNIKNENIVKNLGFELAFGQQSSHIFKKENIFRLPRFSFNEEFGDIERFKIIANSQPLEVFDITPKNTRFKKNNFRLGFSTNENIKNINCYSAGLSLTVEKIPPSRIEIKFNEGPKKGINRINCTSQKNGRLLWYGRILIN